ncbi:hypothetical protein [Pandoraea capi]|uniref:hypothetical protein n=1 Tax=Pandoraea capi TaxID=2508286 RepID=UPI0012400FB8|nr:hypothetical protein [Pandoraea capi]
MTQCPGWVDHYTGDINSTYGKQALLSVGLSPQTAAFTYAAISLGGALTGSVLENISAKQTAALNDLSRLSYIPSEKFGVLGLQPSAELMKTAQAQAIVDSHVLSGLPLDRAYVYAAGLIKTGTALPTAVAVGADTQLIKLVPKAINGNDVISNSSAYFMTKAEYDSLSKLPSNQIAARLGLPAEQGIRGSQFGFDVYSMTPKQGSPATVFTSEVVPVQQGAYFAPGGAQQVLVPNRSQWTDPNANKIGEIRGLRQ